ncbi:MAG: SurA N-terminal domain-containing protein [Treponema sp.]|nr:SurA N-terminal domain-containing protein [Treponema sp.]
MATAGKKKPEHEGGSEMLRRFKANPFLFIGTFVVLGIIVVAFVFVPSINTGSRSGGSGELNFGRYDGIPINLVPGSFFAQQYEQTRQWYSMILGEISPQMEYSIWRDAFETTAVHTAILRTMRRAGFRVPPTVVDREVAGLDMFKENGVFSPTLYTRLDANRRLTLWRQVQENIVRERFLDDVNGLLASDAEGEFLAMMAGTRRSFEMAVFSVDAFPESGYEAFLLENPDLFRSSHLSMITVKGNEREARRVLESVLSGEITFEDAARTYSADTFADRGGDMGPRLSYDLRRDIPDPDLLDTVLALASGEIGDLLRINDAWAFFRAEADSRAPDIADTVLMGDVRAYMRSFARGRMEDWALALAGDFATLVAERGFEAALAMQDVQVQRRSFGPIPLNFGNIELFPSIESADIEEIRRAGSNRQFWIEAFSGPVGSPSRPVVQEGNVLVLLPTEETELDEDARAAIAGEHASWVSDGNEQLLRRYVLDSPLFTDNFDSAMRTLRGN